MTETADSAELIEPLARCLDAATDWTPVTIEDLVRLSGGASRDTWSFDAVEASGARHPLIVQRTRSLVVDAWVETETEACLIEAAQAAGVPVPDLTTWSADPTLLGLPFLILERVEGETIPQRILRSDQFDKAREVLANDYGAALGRIQQIPVDQVRGLKDQDPLTHFAEVLADDGEPHPVLDFGLRWLTANRPPSLGRVVVHGDFRNGNGIVGDDGLQAIIDWELAHFGDPMEDLGWFCIRAWRFGAQLPVGGFGHYEQIIAGYESVTGRSVDRDVLRWWRVMGTVRWAAICLMQGTTHWMGHRRSVELAVTGRRAAEAEFDLMLLLGTPSDSSTPPGSVAAIQPGSMGTPHDRPDVLELVETVRQFLGEDVMGAVDGQLSFHVRVAMNALAIAERELRLGPAHAAAQAVRLAKFGCTNDAELGARIRSGQLDDRADEVAVALQELVWDKISVMNPKYTNPYTPADAREY
ncbi:MAG: phosphotransferase family protein [Actinomycetia bacterium]|nr:phosphotransferase family protein [Actinomycetes bacterium]